MKEARRGRGLDDGHRLLEPVWSAVKRAATLAYRRGTLKPLSGNSGI